MEKSKIVTIVHPDSDLVLQVTAAQAAVYNNASRLDKITMFGALQKLASRNMGVAESMVQELMTEPVVDSEYTGGSVSYYMAHVAEPFNKESKPYTAECQDIINALGLDFNEGCAFKAIWRRATARKGKKKRGYDNGLYDAEKVEFYGNQMIRTTPKESK